MAQTPQAGTDLSREILGEVLGERGKLGSDSQRLATLAEQVQDAIDSGADLGWIQRRFHLSESEGDEDWPESASGY